jgi:hypothetical protein
MLGMADGARDDHADAEVVTRVANALRDWRRATGKAPALKPLREAWWFYWQSPRLPRPGSATNTRTPTAAHRQRGRSRMARIAARLVIEHLVPVNVVLGDLLASDEELTVDYVRQVLERHQQLVAVVTKRESDELSAKGLGRHVGSRQPTGEDPWERYRRPGWNPDDFTPLRAALP